MNKHSRTRREALENKKAKDRALRTRQREEDLAGRCRAAHRALSPCTRTSHGVCKAAIHTSACGTPRHETTFPSAPDTSLRGLRRLWRQACAGPCPRALCASPLRQAAAWTPDPACGWPIAGEHRPLPFLSGSPSSCAPPSPLSAGPLYSRGGRIGRWLGSRKLEGGPVCRSHLTS